jgi:hypothetical protein
MSWLVLLPLLFVAQAPGGELQVYDAATEAGVVAVREQLDSQGRVMQVDYFTMEPMRRDLLVRPPTDDELILHSVDLLSYDDHGHVLRVETMDGAGAPLRDQFLVHGEDGLLRARITAGPGGVRQREERFDTSMGVSVVESVMTFDRTGEQLVTVSGIVPDGMEIASGPQDAGIACGISSHDGSATLVEQVVYVNVFNRSAESYRLGQGPAFVLLEVELRGEDGIPREPDAAALAAAFTAFAQLNRAEVRREDLIRWETLEGGRARKVAELELGRWFPDLTPGPYRLQVRYLTSDEMVGLLSNALEIDVRAASTADAPPDDFGR